jgi:dehydrogenase/reductase SDR family protein 12
MSGSTLDTLLDRTFVGYTRLGYRLRSHSWRQLPRMDGKHVLVTGATSGIGLAAAEGMACLGASLWLLARNPQRAERARTTISERAGNEDVHIELCDLASLRSVRQAAQRLLSRPARLDALVNNAGVLAARRELSLDGLELTFATNIAGPFLLTNLLLPALQESADARIINVSSGGMYAQKLRVEDLQSAHADYDGAAAYARSKRAQVILTELLAQRLAATSVTVNAMHPGWVDTPGLRSSLPHFHRITRPLLRNPAEGADTIIWLAAAPDARAISGRFWHDRRARPAHLLPWTRETPSERERLWQECQRLTSLPHTTTVSDAALRSAQDT